MKDLLIKEILKLKNEININKIFLNKFLNFVNTQKYLTKSEGNTTHLGTFFLPINKKTKSIYLVDHIKAGIWIPPGGHIEKDELPISTIRREFKEELNHQLTKEEIKLFNLSVTSINRPWENCITHYDFWYSVSTEELPFNFLKKEFYDGKWFDLEEGLKIIKRKTMQDIIKNHLFALQSM